MFEQKGMLVVDKEGLNEDTVMEDSLEAGSDFQTDGDVFVIETALKILVLF